MGFLSGGDVLPWSEAKKLDDFIRKKGIEQFIVIYNKNKDRDNDENTWGDEIEYILVQFDHEKKTAKLVLRAHELLAILQQEEINDPSNAKSFWRPEYGSFMLEGTPAKPYGDISTLVQVQESMEYRRNLVKTLLKNGETILSFTSFPLLGVGDYTLPSPPEDWVPGSSETTKSRFIQDQVINPHPRFPFLSKNIRERRTTTVDINIPLYIDTNTTTQYGVQPSTHPTPEDLTPPHSRALPNCIYMDAMAFGMGCSCLQCTFHTKNIDEARTIYDQFLVLSPIFLALTAAAPIFRGFLAATDVRWNTISMAVDDRTPQERGLEPLTDAKFVFSKSRYASASMYISQNTPEISKNNDLNLPINKLVYEQLTEAGVDSILSTHLAHLFIRDPLVIYNNRIELDANLYSDHFENIQSTNWQTVRFKPPPSGTNLGWRVEFRPMEVQFTDFENAAFVILIKLLYHTVLHFDLQFYMPISKVDENMKRAHIAGAVQNQTFFFPKTVRKGQNNEIGEFTIDEIINGKEGGFEGLLPLVESYVATTDANEETLSLLKKYFSLISKRASGELQTAATWIRQFVLNHHAYNHDSIITPEINHDLLFACNQISEGKLKVPELLGAF